jgi:hypothetical protein
MPPIDWGSCLGALNQAFKTLKQECLRIMTEDQQHNYSDLLSAFLHALRNTFGGGGDSGYNVELVLVPDVPG